MLENQNRKKLLRTLLLFLVSFLTVTVSASVYNIMQMQSSPIVAEPAKIRFVMTDDSAEAGAYIGVNGTYVSFNSMAGWPNATRVYEAAVGIRNLDTITRTFELVFDSWSGSIENVDYIKVIVRDAAGGAQQGSVINVGTPGSSTGLISIPAEATWVVEWIIKWKAGASSTSMVSVTLKLIVVGE